MGRDRLNSLLKRRELAVSIKNLSQQHEYETLRNQQQIIQDLDQFAKISESINELYKNVLEIEEELAGSGSVRVSRKLADNANLCYKIFTAVKVLQADLESLSQQRKDEDGDNLVSLVRSNQMECVRTAYFEAFWKFRSLVQNYEGIVRKRKLEASSHQSLASLSQCDIFRPKPVPCENSEDAVQESFRRHTLNENVHRPLHTTVLIEEEEVEEIAAETLKTVQERHQDLQAIERSLVEVRDQFVLFSTLAMEHGSMFNLTETKVQETTYHMATVAMDMEQANYYYRKVGSKDWFCSHTTCCLLMLLAVLVAIAICLAVKKFLLY
ncbi:hypothetical protein RP20_CCG010723 [Aedes albopictus]|nr:hypothetical protein RP20_CCG010723 [Aedes albopictus]